MGSIPAFQIPVINFSAAGSTELDRGTQGWHHLCKRVREACENYGCFEVVFDNIPPDLRAETFSVLNQLFGLSVETKKKNFNPKPYHGYAGQLAIIPLYESFGIEDASSFDSLKSFATLMWPDGHDHLCQTISSIIKQLDELNHAILTSILDSYGLGEKSEYSIFMPCKTLLRLMRYKAPPPGECMDGLHAHTDKPLCTIRCEDQVSGLEVETKDGQWIRVSPSSSSFIFIVGDPLMAWSNGRLHAARHRVMMRGDKDRYSLGAFAVPIEGTIIKPPKELVDEEQPQILKEFDYMDFIRFSYSKEGMALDSAMQGYTKPIHSVCWDPTGELLAWHLSVTELGTEGWHHLCKRVRELAENYGCFELVFEQRLSWL